jgi:maltose O-acetyltransferase
VIFDSNVKVSFPSKLKLGSNVFVGNNDTLRCEGGIAIADGTAIAANAYLLSYNYLFATTTFDRSSKKTQPIAIGSNCLIGAYSVILPGVQLGNNVIVGACSIVTKSFPHNVTIAGNPAQIIKKNVL